MKEFTLVSGFVFLCVSLKSLGFCLWPSSPVRVFLQHLVHADAEGLVIEALEDEIFIYPELGSSDGLALWDPRQVESELSVMPPHWQELLIVFHYEENRQKRVLSGCFCIGLIGVRRFPRTTFLFGSYGSACSSNTNHTPEENTPC